MNPCAMRVLTFVTALLLAPLAARAETALRLPAVFGDHMVLQREQMVPEVNLFNREGLPAAPFRTDQPR